MERIAPTASVERQPLSVYRRFELLTGDIKYPAQGYDGYGDGKSTDANDYISDEMQADWKNNRADLLQFWNDGCSIATEDELWPGTRKPWMFIGKPPDNTPPWAAQVFDDA
jgi:hypothetical protein